MSKTYNYFNWWTKLFFQRPKHTMIGTSPMLIASAIGALAVPYRISNTLIYDPEVRLRPHKRAWHLDEHKIAKSRYRRSFVRGLNPKRAAYYDMVEDNGWEDFSIPQLD
eukprot:493346_1